MGPTACIATAGHQRFVVRYDRSVGGGGFVLAMDAADLTEDLDHELPIGGVDDGDPSDTEQLDCREGHVP